MIHPKAFRRAAVAAFAASVAAGCAARPDARALTPRPSARGAETVSLYAATNRTPEPGSTTTFGATRSDRVRFARYVVSIPPARRHGDIEWPKGAPDAATDFVTVAAAPLTETAFRDAARRSGPAPVALFVHGFNYNYQESVYRLAQVAGDTKAASTPYLFAWPSKASFLAYGDDREAAAASRDDLARVIEMIARGPNARVVLLGHSMGGWLTMEALVALRRQRSAVFGKLQDVVLAAPDISVADFVRQLTLVGRLPVPITLLVSKDDQALELSRLLAGGQERVGSADVRKPIVREAARRFGVRIVDISELASAEGFNHDRYAAMAALYPKFRDQLERRSSRDFAGAGVFVFNARTSKLTPSE